MHRLATGTAAFIPKSAATATAPLREAQRRRQSLQKNDSFATV